MFADTGANATFVGFLALAVLVLSGIPEPAFAAQDRILTIPSTPVPQRIWIDIDGDPLPFYNEDQVMEFLKAAEIVGREDIPVGVTDPIKLRLSGNGFEVHAIFRYVDTVYDRAIMSDGRVRMNFKDSCHFEPAAYEISKLLRMDSVPPVIARRIGTDNGTLQIWVYNAMMEDERQEKGMSAPNRLAWNKQVQQMYIFDALIGNDDRTAQNILIDKNFKLWLIDHTRAFYSRSEVAFENLDKVIYAERGFWEALQGLNTESLKEAVGEYLSNSEIEQLLERRDRVAAHVNQLIETRGEGAVIYEWAPAGR
jgi:hypothetical protein